MDVTRLGNWAISFVQVTGSTISGPHHAVLVGGEGAVAGLEEGDAGESKPDCESFGAPGIVFRPRAPEQVSTPDGTETVGAEAYALRSGDGLIPFTWRDLRLNRAFPAPKPGTVAVVGYGGGFLAFDDTEANSGDQKATINTLYCPYSFSGGVPAKAHAIILDPDEEDVKIVQGDGTSVLLSSDGAIVRSPNGATRIEISDTGIKIVGNVSVVGNMVVGINPLVPSPKTAMVLAVGAGSPPLQPCLSLMVAVPT